MLNEFKFRAWYVIFSTIMGAAILIFLLGPPSIVCYFLSPPDLPLIIVSIVCLALVWIMLLGWIQAIYDSNNLWINSFWIGFNIHICVAKVWGTTVDLDMSRFENFHIKKDELMAWCKENCGARWWWAGYAKFVFASKAEAMQFRLVWG